MPRRRKNVDKKQVNPASSSGAASASSNHSGYSPPRAFEQGEPPLIKPNILNIFGSSLRPSCKAPGAFSSHARASTAKDDGPPECYRDECATSIVFLPYCRPTIYKRCPLPPPPRTNLPSLWQAQGSFDFCSLSCASQVSLPDKKYA